MNSRERFLKTINHQEPDRVVLDLGATSQTGIHASALYQLREALHLEKHSIKIHEPAQILGMVEDDIRKALGVDVVGLWNPTNALGVKNEGWKPWSTPDGTPTLVAKDLAFTQDERGVTYTYPQGDLNEAPSMKLPKDGYFFDNIERGCEFDELELDPKKDFAHDFSVFTDETAMYLEKEAKDIFERTEYGIVGMCGGGSFGDSFTLPAPWVKGELKGIRKMEDWLMAHILYPDYIMELFDMQAEIAIKNLEIYKQAVGDRIQVIWLSGTDFGTQNGPFISTENYRKLYKPYHKKLNDWVHKNTQWKTFYHTCGAIAPLLDDFHDAGIDILNPVQCSAVGMEPNILKEKYGDKFVFWGGGVDTQSILPFGTPEEVRKQVTERIDIFAKGGGYVFNTIHNIVGNTPIDNIMAMFEAVKAYKR